MLKNYKSANDGSPVILAGSDFDKISYPVKTGNNNNAQVSELFIIGSIEKKGAAQVLTYQHTTTGGQTITHMFTLKNGEYLVDWNIQLNGADRLLTQGALNFTWQNQTVKLEKDAEYERQMASVCFYEDEDFDYIQTKTSKKLEKPVQWVSVSQQFFNSTVIAKNNFSSAGISFQKSTDTTNAIALATTTMQAKLPLGTI